MLNPRASATSNAAAHARAAADRLAPVQAAVGSRLAGSQLTVAAAAGALTGVAAAHRRLRHESCLRQFTPLVTARLDAG